VELAKLSLTLNYPITLSQAKQSLEKERIRLNAYLGDQGDDRTSGWDENKLNFSVRILGGQIDGSLALSEGIAQLEATLPFPMLMFRSKGEQRLRKILKIDTPA
jgi:hypothetical protein